MKCGTPYTDFVLTSGSIAKFESTRKRPATVESVPQDEGFEDLQHCCVVLNQ